MVAPPVTDHVYELAVGIIGIEYPTADCDLHTDVGPVTTGVAGRALTVKHRCVLAPQPLFAVTQMVPVFVNEGKKSTTTESPSGATDWIAISGVAVHVYDVAVPTAPIEYVTPETPHRAVDGPVIPPG